MYKIKKHLIMILFVLTSVFMLSSTGLEVLAAETKDIYVEEKIVEENFLPAGVNHKRVKAKSMVTINNSDYIASDASEAGSANNVLIKFNQYYSQQVNVLEIPRNIKTKVIPWGVFGNGGWSLTRVTEMAHDYEKKHPGWKIIGGVNGDFFDIQGVGELPYGPTGSQMVDGDMHRMNPGRPMLGFNNSGVGQPMVGKVAWEVSTTPRPVLAIYDSNDNIIKEFPTQKVNTTPASGEIAVYFAMYNNRHTPVPVHVDNAYVVEKAEDTLAFSEWSVYGKGVISAVHKTGDVENSQFAVVTDNKEVTDLLKENVKIRVQYEITDPDFKNCDSVIGYPLKVLENGNFVGYKNTYDNTRYPRNIVGYREDGTIVMAIIDGRQPEKGMYGVAAEETGAIAKYYGMHECFQMDGGGSATMVILKNGELQVVNSPSDSGGGPARTDSNGILVAVEIPKIEYQILKTFESLEFDVDVLEQMDKNKELYIEVDGKKKKVDNGKVRFEGLKGYTGYNYAFYTKTGETYEILPIQGLVTTTKKDPVVEDFAIYITELNDLQRYQINFKLEDPDKAIQYIILHIGDKKFWNNGAKFKYAIENQSLINNDEWYIEIKYNLQDENGLQERVLKNVPLRIGNTKAIFDAQLEELQKDLDSIFR